MKKKRKTITKKKLKTYKIIEYGTYSKIYYVDAKSEKEAIEKRYENDPIDSDHFIDSVEVEIY